MCSTYQTHDHTEVRNANPSLRSSSQKADTKRARCQNGQNLSLNRLINGPTVATSSAQETTSVRCQQISGNTGKLNNGDTSKVSKTLPT